MCRNGSLAEYSGFDVDADCPLTTIVDGEVVVGRNSRKINGITNALLSLDKYFQLDPDFKMYNIFSGHRDLLFKVNCCEQLIPQCQCQMTNDLFCRIPVWGLFHEMRKIWVKVSKITEHYLKIWNNV